MVHRSMRSSTKQSHFESVARVIAAMHSQIDQPMSTESMAKLAYASPYHFNRVFRQVTGLPPAQFLYALRLDAAKRLLITTTKKVIDICYEVGYNSIGTFTRRFTSAHGLSPTMLRELSRGAVQGQEMPLPASFQRQRSERAGQLFGSISAPTDFHGLIFIGLFDSSLPQAKPVACCIATQTGPYEIHNIPEGKFSLFALGIEYPIRGAGHLYYQSALRGGGHAVGISRDSTIGVTTISLRAPSLFDPPILLTLPMLMKDSPGTDASIAEPLGEFPAMSPRQVSGRKSMGGGRGLRDCQPDITPFRRMPE